jgi:hypothetical protein
MLEWMTGRSVIGGGWQDTVTGTSVDIPRDWLAYEAPRACRLGLMIGVLSSSHCTARRQ